MNWLTGFSYRKKVTISGSSGAGQNYQVKLSIGSSSSGDFHLEGHCVDFPNDIRFTDDDGVTLLDYWIEDPTQDPITVWVKVKDDLDNDVDIYVYYGNSSASSASDGDSVFEFFDDFEDLSKWSVEGTVTIEDGVAKFEAGVDSQIVNTTLSLFDDVAWRWRCKVSGDPTTGDFHLRLGAVNDGYWQDWEHDDDYAVWDDVDNVYIISATKTHDTNWHIRELTRTSSGEFKLWLDDEYVGSAMDTTRTSITETAIRNTHDVHAYVDWVFVRKYADPEPSFKSVGGEEVESPLGVSWWNPLSAWRYKCPITITNNSGEALSDFQVCIELTPSNFNYEHCRKDGGDIRFLNYEENTELPYWVEEWNYNGTSKIWVKIDNIPRGSNVCSYLYYGNCDAESNSDGSATFELFDDFEYEDADAKTTLWTPRYELGWREGGSADIGVSQAGKLRVEEETSSGRHWYAVQGDGKQLPENFFALVDFDIEKLGTSTMNAAVTLEVRDKNRLTGETGFVEIGRGKIDGTDYVWTRINNTSERRERCSENTGKFLLMKMNNTICGYYDTDSGWRYLGVYTIDYDAYIGLTAKLLESNFTEHAQVRCYWDNIRVGKYVFPCPSVELGSEENNTWLYKRPITLTNDSGSELSNFQVPITLTTSNFDYSHCKEDGSDIRFINASEDTKLPYWIEEWNYNGNSKVWVKVDSIPTGSNVCLYLYYGNDSATSESDGDRVFELFDDFENLNSWNEVYITNESYAKTENGFLKLYSKEGTAVIDSPVALENVIIDAKVLVQDNSYGFFFQMSQGEYVNGYAKNGYMAAWNYFGWEEVLALLQDNGGGVLAHTTQGGLSNGETYILSLIFTSPTLKMLNDGTEILSASDSTFSSLSALALRANRSEYWVDWIRVRKYASSEPTYEIGSEAKRHVLSHVLDVIPSLSAMPFLNGTCIIGCVIDVTATLDTTFGISLVDEISQNSNVIGIPQLTIVVGGKVSGNLLGYRVVQEWGTYDVAEVRYKGIPHFGAGDYVEIVQDDYFTGHSKIIFKGVVISMDKTYRKNFEETVAKAASFEWYLTKQYCFWDEYKDNYTLSSNINAKRYIKYWLGGGSLEEGTEGVNWRLITGVYPANIQEVPNWAEKYCKATDCSFNFFFGGTTKWDAIMQICDACDYVFYCAYSDTGRRHAYFRPRSVIDSGEYPFGWQLTIDATDEEWGFNKRLLEIRSRESQSTPDTKVNRVALTCRDFPIVHKEAPFVGQAGGHKPVEVHRGMDWANIETEDDLQNICNELYDWLRKPNTVYEAKLLSLVQFSDGTTLRTGSKIKIKNVEGHPEDTFRITKITHEKKGEDPVAITTIEYRDVDLIHPGSPKLNEIEVISDVIESRVEKGPRIPGHPCPKNPRSVVIGDFPRVEHGTVVAVSESENTVDVRIDRTGQIVRGVPIT